MLSNIENEIELIRRHIKILRLVVQKEPIGIIRLSSLSGLPLHKVRYSLRILEQNGLIKASPKGAVTTPKGNNFIKAFPNKMRALINRTQSI
ncbi:MAG: hypothetical protein ACE5NL_01270 [Candidatus Hydrothermarchaeaceae archaeon]